MMVRLFVKLLHFVPPRPPPPAPADRTAPYCAACPAPPAPLASEDCLYLNLFAPPRPALGPPLPILVWLRDSERQYGPDFLIENDIIVIAVNYRLGPLGFLNVGNEVALGNMGAKDVVAALRWIRDNAAPFGGDADNVSVCGSGEGATLAALLPLSAAAKGLFSKVIVQGGSSLRSDIFRRDPRRAADRLYRRLERACDGESDAWELLSNSTSARIVAASVDLYDGTETRDDQRLVDAFGPSVEVENEGAFLSLSPVEAYDRNLVQSKVPMMLGYANLEALHRLGGLAEKTYLLPCLNYNFQYVLPFEGRANEFCSRRYNAIGRRIMDLYFSNGTITKRSLRRYINYVSDQTVYPVHRLARQHATAGSPVYLYRMSFEGSCNLARRRAVGERREPQGATAGDEICYLFRCSAADERYTAAGAVAERTFIKKIVRLWTNFVKYGEPTPAHEPACPVLGSLRWSPLAPSQPLLLRLGRRCMMAVPPELKRVRFWDGMKEEFFDGKFTRFRNEL